jgi:hypothetical protein
MSRSYFTMGRRRIESSLLMRRMRTLSPVEFDTVPFGNFTEFALELSCAWWCIVFLSRKLNKFRFWLHICHGIPCGMSGDILCYLYDHQGNYRYELRQGHRHGAVGTSVNK